MKTPIIAVLYVYIWPVATVRSESPTIHARAKTALLQSCPAIQLQDAPEEIYLDEKINGVSLYYNPRLNEPSIFPLKSSFKFSINRILKIDDLTRTISLIAMASLKWYMPCTVGGAALVQIFGDQYPAKVSKFSITFDKEIWYPQINVINSATDPKVFHDEFVTRANYVVSFPMRNEGTDSPAVNTSVMGEVGSPGQLEFLCDGFIFTNFPFDKASCTIIFATQWPISRVNFTSVCLEVDNVENVLYNTDQWEFVSTKSEIASDPWNGETYQKFSLTINLRRKSEYCINTIFVPLVLLTALQIFALAMESDLPDR